MAGDVTSYSCKMCSSVVPTPEYSAGHRPSPYSAMQYSSLEQMQIGMSFEWMMQGIAEAIWISSVTRIFDVLSLSKYLLINLKTSK